jgi:hypothetical protein
MSDFSFQKLRRTQKMAKLRDLIDFESVTKEDALSLCIVLYELLQRREVTVNLQPQNVLGVGPVSIPYVPPVTGPTWTGDPNTYPIGPMTCEMK